MIDVDWAGDEIAIIGPGTGFGEVALIKPNTRRAATAIVEVPTELLLLERAAYDRCLKGAHSQRLAMLEKQSFLAELPLFSLWRPAQVSALAHSMTRRRYLRDEVIVLRGAPVKDVQLITSGEVALSVAVEVPGISGMGSAPAHATTSMVSAIELSRAGTGTWMGDQEVLFEKASAITTCTVTSQEVVTYELSRENFERLVMGAGAVTGTPRAVLEAVTARRAFHERRIERELRRRKTRRQDKTGASPRQHLHSTVCQLLEKELSKEIEIQFFQLWNTSKPLAMQRAAAGPNTRRSGLAHLEVLDQVIHATAPTLRNTITPPLSTVDTAAAKTLTLTASRSLPSFVNSPPSNPQVPVALERLQRFQRASVRDGANVLGALGAHSKRDDSNPDRVSDAVYTPKKTPESVAGTACKQYPVSAVDALGLSVTRASARGIATRPEELLRMTREAMTEIGIIGEEANKGQKKKKKTQDIFTVAE